MKTAPLPVSFGYGRIFDKTTVARLRADAGEWIQVKVYWNTKNLSLTILRPADIEVSLRAVMVQRVCRVEVWARAVPGAR